MEKQKCLFCKIIIVTKVSQTIVLNSEMIPLIVNVNLKQTTIRNKGRHSYKINHVKFVQHTIIHVTLIQSCLLYTSSQNYRILLLLFNKILHAWINIKLPKIPVSYTHLDVYKRQLLQYMLNRMNLLKRELSLKCLVLS